MKAYVIVLLYCYVYFWSGFFFKRTVIDEILYIPVYYGINEFREVISGHV